MRQQDSTLQYWSDRIDSLGAEYERAKTNTSYLKNDLDSTWESLRLLQEEYRFYKEQADYEFQQAAYCWSVRDGANAKEHSMNGHNLNEKKITLGNALDSAHAKHDAAKNRFNESVSYQRSVKEDLDVAKAAHKARVEELKELRFQESLHWHDKSCVRCGGRIKYNDEWTHIPNYCKDCREAFERERKEKEKRRVVEKAEREEKWKEKPCNKCGNRIRYNIEWSHPPNVCSDCKEKLKVQREQNRSKGSDEYKLRFNPKTGKNDFFFGTNNPRKGDGHGHVIIDDNGQVHYVRDSFDPHKTGDRESAESYDDGFFF